MLKATERLMEKFTRASQFELKSLDARLKRARALCLLTNLALLIKIPEESHSILLARLTN